MVGKNSSSRSCEQSGYSKQFAHLDPIFSCRAVPCHIFVHDMSPTIVPYMYFFYYLFRIQDIWYLCTRVIYIQNLRWPCIDWTRFQSLEASHCGWAAKIATCLQGACAVQDIQSKIKRHQYTRSKNMSHTLCSCMYLNDICNYLILFCRVYFHIRMYSCIGSDMHIYNIYIYMCACTVIYICIFVFVYACCSRSSVGNNIPSHIWTTSKERLNAHHIKQNGVSPACQCWFKWPGCHCRIHAVTQSSIIFQISWDFTCIYVVGLICDPVSILCVWQLFELGHRNTVEVNAPAVTALWDQRFEMGLLLQLRWASPVRKKSFQKKRSHCRWCWVGACNPETTSGSYALHVLFSVKHHFIWCEMRNV